MVIINGKKIGRKYKPYIIAELSANHNGKIEKAFESIKVAKKMKADAIKFQTYTPDTLTIDCDKKDFQINEGYWKGDSLYQLYEKAYTPFEWHKDLFDYSKHIGITCFSTAFDKTAVDLLENLNTPAYKVASFEIVDLPLIKYIAQTHKPMILSTGMASLIEIEEAINTATSNGCTEIILLHCVSGYPTPFNESNLLCIPDLSNRFNLVTGLSDHTLGTSIPVAAVTLGASLIEKHFTLDKNNESPDSFFSIEPNELRELVINTKNAWKALGYPNYNLKKVEKNNIKFRRSIYIVKNIKKGEKFNKSNIRIIRPGYGLSPKYFNQLVGKTSKFNIQRGTAFDWSFINKEIV